MFQVNNTVSAVNQMKNLPNVSFLGNERANVKILIVGNSITRHAPKEEIGWPNDWGMAASAPENDYVHRLFAMLQQSGVDAYVRVRQGASWETTYQNEDCLQTFREDRDFGADVVIFRLGENVKKETISDFKPALHKLLDFLCKKDCKVIMTTCFWESAIRDDVIKQVAAERGFLLADIHCTDEKQMAIGQFAHQGVAAHPSDLGMQMIAQRIFEKLQ